MCVAQLCLPVHLAYSMEEVFVGSNMGPGTTAEGRGGWRWKSVTDELFGSSQNGIAFVRQRGIGDLSILLD